MLDHRLLTKNGFGFDTFTTAKCFNPNHQSIIYTIIIIA